VPLREWLERQGLGSAERLWQKLRIAAGWETAVEAVLRERLHALQADAIEPQSGERPPAKASLFQAAAQLPSEARDGVPLASKVHVVDDAIGGALADWLAGVFAIDGAPDAATRSQLPAGAVLVNRQGDQFTRYTASYHAPDSADAGLLARQAEIEALDERCAELGRQLEAAKRTVEQAEAERLEREAALDEARLEIGRQEQARHDAEIESLKLAQAEERYRERSAQLRAEEEELAAEADERRAALEACQAAAERIGGEIAAARERLEQCRSAYIAAETALAEQRKLVQQAEREAQDALFGERECGSKIVEVDNSVRLIDQQIERADQELARLANELAADPIPAVRQALDAAVESRLSCEKTLAGARNTVEAAAGTLREIEEARLAIEARLAPLREKQGELRLKEQAASLSYEQYAAQLREAGADDGALATAAEDAPRPSALQGEITRLAQQINELGAVNLAAVEELRTSRERKGYLDSQASDLEEAIGTLEDAIRRIDRETRELLRETFDSVNRHFGSLFPSLFGGGEAKLIMTGEEILDAGVQVMAQPPGKRNSSIHLLSGGEKALTAIALVFSLFQLNPAPFCLLDEVDAPLDDSNTVRFCELVRKMSAQTQFLFISHNKITMELAEQLIGVTMPESGVSRVVAVDIDEALRMREELAA
jgi:chromosome segregation protein